MTEGSCCGKRGALPFTSTEVALVLLPTPSPEFLRSVHGSLV
jgi:hypothetical protein